MTEEYVEYNKMCEEESEPNTIDDLVALETVSVPTEEPVANEGEDAVCDEPAPIAFEMVDTVDEALASLEENEEPPAEESVEDATEEVTEPEVPVEETTPLVFVPLVDDGMKLNIREAPDGAVKTKVDPGTKLTCVEDGASWAWVEFDVDGEKVRGYANKDFLVTVDG